MQIRTTARWLLISTSVLTFSCGKDISVGANESRSQEGAANHGGSHGSTVSIQPDASIGGSNAAGAPQMIAPTLGTGGTTGTYSGGTGGAVDLPGDEDAGMSAGSCGDRTGMGSVDVVWGDWILQPGQEQINCAQKTVNEDLDIIGLDLKSPNAVSVTLSIVSRGDVVVDGDGGVACDSTAGLVVFSMGAPSQNHGGLFGGLMLPAGNAIHVARDQRLLLRTDLVNTSAQPVSGESLVQAILADGGHTLSTQPLPVTLRTDCVQSQLLIQTQWSLEPGTESYLCTRKTLSSSFDFDNILVDTPAGTHHYYLSVGPSTGPDGTVGCPEASPPQARLLVTSPDGNSATYPAPGGSANANAGEQVLLKLHLVNTQNSPIGGTTSVHVQD